MSQGIYSQSRLLGMHQMIQIETDIPSWWRCVPPTSQRPSFPASRAAPKQPAPRRCQPLAGSPSKPCDRCGGRRTQVPGPAVFFTAISSEA